MGTEERHLRPYLHSYELWLRVSRLLGLFLHIRFCFCFCFAVFTV